MAGMRLTSIFVLALFASFGCSNRASVTIAPANPVQGASAFPVGPTADRPATHPDASAEADTRLLRLMDWQRQCAAYDDESRPVWIKDASARTPSDLKDNYVNSTNAESRTSAGVGPFALWPQCWRNLNRELAIQGRPLSFCFFEDKCWPIVFLHERTSPCGMKRIICIELRPNIDHAQMCSLDCAIITPATHSSAAKTSARVVAWIPG
jgi:hypothetical protein